MSVREERRKLKVKRSVCLSKLKLTPYNFGLHLANVLGLFCISALSSNNPKIRRNGKGYKRCLELHILKGLAI